MSGFPSNWWFIARSASSAILRSPGSYCAPDSFLAKGQFEIGIGRHAQPLRSAASVSGASRQAIGSSVRATRHDAPAITPDGPGNQSDARAINPSRPRISPTARGIQPARPATRPTARGIRPGAPAIRSDYATREPLARQREALASEQAPEIRSIMRFWLISPTLSAFVIRHPSFVLSHPHETRLLGLRHHLG